MPRRTNVERHLMAREYVGCVPDIVPTLQIEACMMEAPFLRASDEGDVVRFVAATEECTNDRLPIAGDHPLSQMKAQHFGKQRQVGVDVVAIKQTVIEPRRLHAP